jgi:DnaJ like chaperone protein
MSKIKYLKYLGGALGWAFGGPIGGILGFIMGSVADAGKEGLEDPNNSTNINNHSSNDFSVSLLVLCAAVMKADGKVVVGELDFVRDFFKRNFGEKKAEERILLLRDILKQNIPVRDVCIQIKAHIDHASRLEMLHLLFGIATADGSVANEEDELIKSIAYWLGISSYDYESIKAMFLKGSRSDITWAYKVLETNEEASTEDLKKAYRKMAVKFHPDKVSHLGVEYQKDATEKFKKVQEAWELIKKKHKII